ncbi:PREDICTED: MAD2L1-binding protein-like [Wasmannia auropunctata]|uniref:MAD2L1-binding protein-like n=1 Tax=Wasmannia auropunctata TaxID=64793 RepID=UPI0005EEDEE8|nr:PREDICTED: MAD2L1-binding protein-like [Wasmannia auropunctata]XP_011707226.1 PREDICTED: MAD2L1-binding protein-like [Wasmannia auropunctata]
MFSRERKGEMEIVVTLDEPLTSDSCTKVVMELIKYILYQKQQIPLTYEALARFQTSVKATDRNAVSFGALSGTLKNVSDHLSSQFFLKGCDIKEVAIMLGATILSPKLYIGIELPSYVLNSKRHKEYQHSSAKPLLKLMRSMLECDEFQKAMDVPLNMTNMFVMLRKSDSNSVSDFFLPKPQYVPPAQATSCFRIRLCHGDQVDVQCSCRTLVEVYHDSCETYLENEDDVQYTQYNSSTQSSYRWYQSKQIIKGFKYHL